MTSSYSPTNGDQVRRLSDGRVGTVSRVIATDGALGGLVEVIWDGQRRPSRRAGFEAVNGLEVLGLELRYRTGLVTFA